MEFLFEAEAIPLGDRGMEQVKFSQLDTQSWCPRTNKRKLRAYLVRVVGVHPTRVKKALLALDLVQAPRKNLSVLREWIRNHAPEVPPEHVGMMARMVKRDAESPYGVLCGFERRVVAKAHNEYMLEEEARLNAAYAERMVHGVM